MKKIYPILTLTAAIVLAGCAPVKRDVLPTLDFKALEKAVEAPKEQPKPKKLDYMDHIIFGGIDEGEIKDARVKMAFDNDYDAEGCDIQKVDGEKIDAHLNTFRNLLIGITYGGDGSYKGELQFRGNKRMDAVLLKQGSRMYIAVGKKGFKLEHLWFFDSMDNCKAEVFENVFKGRGKSLVRLVRKSFNDL